jgi:beta-glucosidase
LPQETTRTFCTEIVELWSPKRKWKTPNMIEARYTFPQGFLWGTATSSHQVEGGNTNNDWWQWEQEPERIIHGDSSGDACEWWSGRWKEDLDRAAATDQNAHRLSIEWSRVEPHPAIWDEEALRHYAEILQGARARGLQPMVSLHHFTNPIWVTERGGWLNADIVTLFERYVRKVVGRLSEFTDLWVTINEPSPYVYFAYIEGSWPPGNKSLKDAWWVLRNIVRAHAAAYHAIHEIQPRAKVGLAHHLRRFKPFNASNPAHRWLADLKHRLFNLSIPSALQNGRLRLLAWRARIPEAAGTQDFFGLNYYTTDYTMLNLIKPIQNSRASLPPSIDVSPTGFIANEPQALWEVLDWVQRYGLPIYITENGVEDDQDDFRRRYLAMHLHQLWRAANFNWKLRGYFHWSLVDNFEWERGWSQRFGLWGLNPATQIRTKRKSADFYAEICRANALSSEVVAAYAPDVLDELYPPRGPDEVATMVP